MKKLKIVIYIIVLSLNTPIGIFIGIMIFDNSDEESGEHILINGILQADWDSRLVKKKYDLKWDGGRSMIGVICRWP